MTMPINIKSVFFILTTAFFLSGTTFGNECKFKEAAAYKRLIEQGATISTAIQVDFGRLKKSSSCYLEAWPSNTQEVSQLIKIAYAYNLPIRTQGAAHSENGSSLPRRFELLIHTSQLNRVSFDHLGTITTGTGIPIAFLKLFIKNETNYILPVANGGGIGPTVGGFISASGMNESSEYYGGFWENVNSITLVTGNGKILVLKKDNPIFKYLFGSMGQLGVITEAELHLLPNIHKPVLSTLESTNQIQFPISDGNFWKKEKIIKPVYWLNVLVPPNKLTEAKQDLQTLQNKYPHAMLYMPIYQWNITFINFMPPLLYNENSDFIAMGIWGTQSIYPDSQEQLNKLNTDFTHLIMEKKYKRYIQAEPAGTPDLYKQYFPEETYKQFKHIKTVLDPKFLFNKGSFFKD